jgi:beta-xylosidase
MLNAFFISPIVLLLLVVSGAMGQTTLTGKPATYNNPVLAGDYPDPSVIRVGGEYWATATSSEWEPHFPLFHSRDLVNWEVTAAVFQTSPDWAESSFWAPEISDYQGRYYVMYTARRKGGRLCVASASADKPEGPYADNGPLVCDEEGSIDGFSIDDENGQRHLIWKSDGNSRGVPTIIWAQPLSEDAERLSGEKKELIRNDADWERNVVEGPFVLRRDGYFYLFYSGSACCGLKCDYALGVARSKSLLGPWEKYAHNPIIKSNEEWSCPGHGSIVTDANGKNYLLYHAYNRRGSVYVGRQAVLDEITWTSDEWPQVRGAGVSVSAPAPLGVAKANSEYTVEDRFAGTALQSLWQWPSGDRPTMQIHAGVDLAPSSDPEDLMGAVIARSTVSPDYTAETEVIVPQQGMAGLSTMGDRDDAIGAGLRRGKWVLWERRRHSMRVLATAKAPDSGSARVRVRAKDGSSVQFSYSVDAGKTWKKLGSEQSATFLPPWDRSIRIALYSGGTSAAAHFNYFRMTAVPVTRR